MSLLSDRQIKESCVRPTHVIQYAHMPNVSHKLAYCWAGVTHTQQYLDQLIKAQMAVTLEDYEKAGNQRWWPMIEPFSADSISKGVAGNGIASFGCSSYGYDIRAGRDFKIFKGQPHNGVIDYKNMTDDLFETVTDVDKVVIPPNGFILARSVEYVRIPRNVLALCIGKSTIARAGINCLCTPLEPEWEGHITLEFSNTTNLPNTFYAEEGVLQLVFLTASQDCDTSYADRKGKYQGQGAEIILPRV